jgi:hypothetical protein
LTSYRKKKLKIKKLITLLIDQQTNKRITLSRVSFNDHSRHAKSKDVPEIKLFLRK